MRFELMHALRDLDERTPEFFKKEALFEGDLTAKMVAIRTLESEGDPKVVDLLKEMLRIV